MAKKSLALLAFILLLVMAKVSLSAQEPPTPSAPPPQAQQAPTPKPEVAPAPKVSPPPRPPERRLVPPPTAARTTDMVSLNFNRAELVEVIHVLAQHLKLTYTIDPEVKGTVTIYSAEPLKKVDLLPIFHQVLRMNGAVAVKTGELYRIAPIKEGKGLAQPLAQGKEGSYALQVVPVRFFSVAEMKKLLTPFVTPGGEILDHPRGNFLIIVDLPFNIQRLMEIRDLIDVNVFAGARMEIYQPKVGSAEELAAEMTKIMQAYASSTAQAEGFAAQFLPIPRINQLLVIGHSEAAWTYVKRWLERIDTAGEGPGRRIFIYPVQNGKASELADILNQVLGQTAVTRREPPRTLQDLHRGTPTAPGAPRTPTSPFGGTPPPAPGAQVPPLGAFAVAPAPGQPQVLAPTPPGVAPTAPGQPGARPQEQLRIVPDPATNSLIIYGTAQEFQNIKGILKDLDMVPRQVLMDVLVAEVTLSDDLRFGIEYEIKRRTESIGQVGTIGSADVPLPVGGLYGTLTAANVAQGLTAVLGKGQDFRAIINALMSDSRVKVLSSPSILAADNRPARIQVGTEEPVPTGTVQSPVSGGTITSSTTIQYRNTGRILTIIPQVNSQGLVHLQIKAEVSQRGTDVRVGQDTFPSFDTRDAETTAVVQDGETLAIGGIITDRKSRSRIGIPFLMDMPVFGRFFGTTTDDIDRTELVMLITPHVIRNSEESRNVTEEFKERLSTVKRELEMIQKERETERRQELKSGDQKEEPKKEQEKETIAPKPSSSAPRSEPGATLSQALMSNETTETAAGSGAAANVIKPEPPGGNGEVQTSLESRTKGKDVSLGEETRTSARKTKTEDGTTKTRTQIWSVQVGSNPDEETSESLARKLKEQGYDAHIIKASIHGQVWYRVRVGRFAEKKEAKGLESVFRSKEGFAGAFTVLH